MSDVKVNKVWWAEYNKVQKEMRGQSPEVVHRAALKSAHEKRKEYLRRNHGKSARQ